MVDRQRRLLERRLKAKVVDEWNPEVTHLVAHTFRRTTKFMCAVCRGIPIVTPQFLDACHKEGRVLDVAGFLLKDSVCEAAFAKTHGLHEYTLDDALRRAREQGLLLQGRQVHVAGTVPNREDLRLLVEAAGGRYLLRLDGKRRTAAANASELHGPEGPQLLRIGVDFDPELLREAACTQRLRFDEYRLA